MSAHPKTGQFRYGIVTEVDAARARIKVRLPEQGDLVTTWLPMTSPTAMKDRHYGLPEPGSQVALLTDALCEDGVVLGSIYSDPDPIPGGADAAQFGTWFEDGTIIRYHKGEHGLLVDLSAAQGAITIQCQAASVTAETVSVQAETVSVTTAGAGLVITGGEARVTAATVALAAPTIAVTGLVTIDGDIDI